MSVENVIQQFSNDELGANIRVIDRDGEPWFVARDIAKAMGYPESSLRQMNNLMHHVPEEWKRHNRIMVRSENGVDQDRIVLCLAEQGLYFFLGRSDKLAALPFQKWLAGEVLPSIRKHGAYMTDSVIEKITNDPASIIALAEALLKERARSELAEERLKIFRPKKPFGTVSEHNGRPRTKPISGYFRSTKTTTTTVTEVTEEQKRLFDFDSDIEDDSAAALIPTT